MTYEREIITEEDFCCDSKLSDRLKVGWEIEKTEIVKKEEKFFFNKTEKLVKVHHLIRDITPTKIGFKLNLTATVPKWEINNKLLDGYEFNRQRGLKEEE